MATGNTLHIKLVDKIGAVIGAELLGAAEGGTDELEGDLTAAGSGNWRGTVTATSDRTIQTNVLGTTCDTALTGSQEMDVVATRGSYAENRNLKLVLTPKAAPVYSSYPECDQPPVKVKASNGIEWLWTYLEEYRGGDILVRLPDKPGVTWEWEFGPHPAAQHYYPDPGGCGDLQLIHCSHKTTLTVEYR